MKFDIHRIGRYLLSFLSVLILLLFSTVLVIVVTPVESYVANRIFTDLESIKNLSILELNGDTILSASQAKIQPGLLRLLNNELYIRKAKIDRLNVKLVIREGEEDLAVKRQVFNTKNGGGETGIWLHNILINNGSLEFHNMNQKSMVPGAIDYNHIILNDLYLNVEKFFVVKDTVFADIVNLSSKEQSGFHLKKLAADMLFLPHRIISKNVNVKTSMSELSGREIVLKYDDWKDFKRFTQEVEVDYSLNPSVLHPKDISYFFPKLKGIEQPVSISGHKVGSLQEIWGDTVRFSGENIKLLEDKVSVKKISVQGKVKKKVTTQ